MNKTAFHNRSILAAMLILALCLVACVALAWGLPASDEAFADPAEHTHDGVNFIAWTSTTSLPGSSGSYYLTADVTISSTWTVPSGTTNLCLNGHGIKMTGNNSVVTINAGAILKLYDCDTTTEHRYSLSNAKSNGAGFATVNDSLTSGYLTFKGGYITGGKGTPVSSWSRGGALYIEGAVEMYGGTLIGNGRYDVTHGGAFNTQGTGSFKMYGGSIQNNAGKCGGATRLQGSGSCEIYGGKIVNNIVSADGGGIHVGGEISVILQDCEISGNYAGNGPGAGIWMTTTGTVISGRTIITNNLTNSGACNVEIGNGYVIGVGELTDGATIGIKMQSGTGAFTSGWSAVMGDAASADYFTSDNAAYSVFLSAGEANVGIPPHEHDGIDFQAWTETTSLPTTGNWYLSADVRISEWSGIEVTENLSICLNGYGITAIQPELPSYNALCVLLLYDDVEFNLCDCGTRVHYFDVDENGLAVNVNETAGEGRLSFTGGYLTGGHADSTSWTGCGGVEVYGDNVTFNMYGGTILGNYGGGIYTGSSTFRMYGGNVCYNVSGADAGCGGVRIGGGEATISGGSIHHNTANYAGGLMISYWGDGAVTITGGSIVDNRALAADGYGGIADNTDRIVLSGDPIITGNTAGGAPSDLCLYYGDTIAIGDPIASTARIGVRLLVRKGIVTSGLDGRATVENFINNHEGYEVRINDDGELEFYEHEHVWAYSAQNGVITATCTVEGCVLGAETLTVSAEGKIYDGTAVTATLSPSNGWTSYGLPTPIVVYSGNTNAGTYTASVTVGGQTATASFTIAKATPTITIPTDLTAVYGDTLADVRLPEGWSWDVPAAEVGSVGEHQHAATFTPADPANYRTVSHGLVLTVERRAETKVDVKAEEMQEINVEVGGLDAELAIIEQENPNANSISVVMTVEPKVEAAATNAEPIRDAAGDRNLEFYEIKVEKTVDAEKTFLEETSGVIEIAIPCAFTGKKGLTVYSYHGEAVRTFVLSDNREDGTFRVDKENGVVYVYSRLFSTYALGYTPYYHVAGTLSLGSFTGTATVTLEDQANGTVYTLEDVALNAVDFTGLPKGHYLMTVTWTDGATNSITMPISVGAAAEPAAPEEPEAEEEPAAAESVPLDDPFEDVADGLDDVVLEDRKQFDDLFALPKRHGDNGDAV